MYYFLYRTASVFAHPFLPSYLRRRSNQGKEDTLRIGERFGKSDLPRPHAPLIWIHAASMGESQSVLPMIQQWMALYPTLHVLMTTVTVTSAKHMATKLPERALHQYAPLDTPRSVQRFLRHWKPDMACFVDSELWPNMLMMLKEKNIPVARRRQAS